MRDHLVWDWNGTLLDDLTLVVHSTNHALAMIGGPAVDVDEHRRSFRRPVADRLRPVTVLVQEGANVGIRIDVEPNPLGPDGARRPGDGACRTTRTQPRPGPTGLPPPRARAAGPTLDGP